MRETTREIDSDRVLGTANRSTLMANAVAGVIQAMEDLDAEETNAVIEAVDLIRRARGNNGVDLAPTRVPTSSTPRKTSGAGRRRSTGSGQTMVDLCLDTVNKNPSGLTAEQIAKLAGLEANKVYVIMGRMAREGRLSRQYDQESARWVYFPAVEAPAQP